MVAFTSDADELILISEIRVQEHVHLKVVPAALQVHLTVVLRVFLPSSHSPLLCTSVVFSLIAVSLADSTPAVSVYINIATASIVVRCDNITVLLKNSALLIIRHPLPND